MSDKTENLNKKRITVIDRLRGLCLISMIIYHAMWDCVFIFNINIPWFSSTAGYVWQQSIGWGFILISGFCINLGKKKLKRGITVFICGITVSIVTLIFMPDDIIVFGVLTLIGSCMLITAAADNLLKKVPCPAGVAINFLLFIVFKKTQKRLIGIPGIVLFTLPEKLYRNYFTAFFGLPFSGFRSADYYPLIPWIFLFMTGYYMFILFNKHDILKKETKIIIKHDFLSFFGRHSLLIYMIHQPVIYGILYLIFNVIN